MTGASAEIGREIGREIGSEIGSALSSGSRPYIVDLVISGTPVERKQALRQIASAPPESAPETLEAVLPFLRGADPLERHRAAKIVRKLLLLAHASLLPHARTILEAVQPMLMDPHFLTRQEARELLGSLCAAVGIAEMLRYLRPDLEHPDDAVRRGTVATLAALAAVDTTNVLGFVRAAARAPPPLVRNTALRSIAEIARLFPGTILPNLPLLVAVTAPALSDSVPQCRLSACAATTGMATACSPFGIETLEQCVPALWAGARTHRGKGLAWFIRTLASLMPLMDPEAAPEYAHAVLNLCQTHFDSSDDEVKKSVCRAITLAEPAAPEVLNALVAPFFAAFWTRRLALDRAAAQLILTATRVLARTAPVFDNILATNALKDPSPFQTLALDTLQHLVTPASMASASERTQELLCDGLVTALQHSRTTNKLLVGALGAFFTSMGSMLAPYIEPLVSTIVECLNNPLPAQRELACLVVVPLAPVIKGTDHLVSLGSILNEQLGEQEPQVLTAVMQALQAICSVVGLAQMQPPVGDLLPRLTPILRNKDDNIVQACISLIGEIAQRGPEYAGIREWMRIANELIEIFKAPRKSVRRMANNTFGYIARGIGPQDVLASLLTSLKLERQTRVNAAVAIAIIADTCEPFSVLPALLNEYRSPSIHVQHGALKALAFVFEYTPAPQYLDSVTTLVDHALTSRNQVSRQTGAEIVKHLALKSIGHDYEDVFIHLLNELWPHIFEKSPHVIDRIMQAVQAVQGVVGVGSILPYLWAGLFHSARTTRDAYWQLYNAAYVQSQHAMVEHYPVQVSALDVWF